MLRPKGEKTFAERSLQERRNYPDKMLRSVVKELFPLSHALLPQINQIYELDLAHGEYCALSDNELIERGAYFRSIDGTPTYHFRICTNTPGQVNASASQERKNFFAANIFAVGYATHGLFPYRGKFHPQMIKAVMNIMGLKPGNVVLDPMAGCGTTSIEASIMGIHSIAYELNPFACLMTRAKVQALEMDFSDFPRLLNYADDIYQRFAPFEERLRVQRTLFQPEDSNEDSIDLSQAFPKLPGPLRELLLLCYLDAVGYASRRQNKTPGDLFPDLLSRYFAAVRSFNETRAELRLSLGQAHVVEGDARQLQIPSESVDGVLFSPPYSFAIDYVENDRPQLQFLGADIDSLKQNMIGLVGHGRTKQELIESRLLSYFEDMKAIMGHCNRVLRSGCYCVIVIGSNVNQTGGVSLEDNLIEIGARIGMPLEFKIMRQIEGIRNTMRDEFLLFFRKP